jgi:hypothetical protein
MQHFVFPIIRMARYNRKPRRNVRRRRLQQTSGKSSTSRYSKVVRQGAAMGRAAAGAYKMYRTAEGMSGIKRMRGESSSSSSKRQYIPQSGNDFTKVRSRYGRRISLARRSKKLMSQNLNRTTLSMYSYGAWNRGLGNWSLPSCKMIDDSIRCPVHLYDVTAVPQKISANTREYPINNYFLRFTEAGDSGTVRWTYSNGAGGTLGNITDPNNPQTTTTLNKDVSMYPTYMDQIYAKSMPGDGESIGSKSFIENVNAKFAFYGPQQARISALTKR